MRTQAVSSDNTPSTTKFIRLPEIMRRYPLSRTTIYRLIGLGQFPAPVKISSRSVAWPESSVEAWAQAKLGAAQGDEAVARER
jgi:prophage regulatory protein